ncbi:dihydroorotate dehydrogenase [Parahypoxylon ruwenzoriense]
MEREEGPQQQPQPPPPIHVDPPLLNSASPWATTLEDLGALYSCPSTGAITTRTSLLRGFAHNPEVHKYSFFNANTYAPEKRETAGDDDNGDDDDGEEEEEEEEDELEKPNASVNNLGYSPTPLDEYLAYIETIVLSPRNTEELKRRNKLFIISVTGPPDDVAMCYGRIAHFGPRAGARLAVEINLSCPNIPGAPPPAYDGEALARYLSAMARAAALCLYSEVIPWGIKTPPYTHAGQFDMLVGALRGAAREDNGGDGSYCPASFVTAVNTLGSCLLLENVQWAAEGVRKFRPKLAAAPGRGDAVANDGMGGMAGAPLHPLALGNVATLRRGLDAHPETRHVRVLGVGGVEDAEGFRRMRAVGAYAVAVGTALGRKGVRVFEEIERGLGGEWGAGTG